MKFTELFVRRPVLSTVLSLLILLLGIQGLMGLSIRQYPEVDETVISITTVYPGASPDLMQGFVSNPVAKAVASAEGVDYVTSESQLGRSVVSAVMRLNSDPDKALTEVTSKVQQVRGRLPTDAEDPIIQKGTGRSFALMYLAFTSDVMNPRQVTEYLTRVVQPRLSTVEGVADAQLIGGQSFAMRVWVDPVRLASKGLTATDIVSAIRSSNFLSSPGKTENDFVAYAIQTQTTLQTAESLGAIPVLARGDEVVRLSDVARVELGGQDTSVKVSFNGQEGVFVGVFPTPAANPLETSAAVKAVLPELQESLPDGMYASIVYDSSDFIDASIVEVFKTILEASVIVILVVLLFLGSFRSVIIPVVTIPLSLIGVCIFLYALGYSLNTLTLLAMVLAIGLVVDDAIVVVENIHRHIERGLQPFEAAIVGIREVTGPVVAMTITLAAVYAPIGFVQGLTGSLFREFAFALAGAVIISGVIALTLSPMMSSKLLIAHGDHGGSRFQRLVDRVFDKVGAWYGRRLRAVMGYGPVVLFVVALFMAITGFMFMKTSSELAPDEDQGALFAMVQAPEYATSDYTKLYVDQFSGINAAVPELSTTFSLIGMGGGNSGIAVWKFVPWDERERSAADLKAQIQSGVNDVAGVRAFLFSPPSLPGTGGGMPVQYVIRSVSSPERVFEVAEEVRKKAMASGRFITVQNALSYQSPQARIIVDRDRAATLGVQVSEIGATLNVLMGETAVSKFDRDARSYDIIPQAESRDRLNPENLGSFYVRSASGEMVPLSAVIRVETRAAPGSITQFNQLNSATLSAMPLPGVTSSEALAVLRSIAAAEMPSGFFEDFIGQSRLEIQEGNSMVFAFALAVVVIYLVLAAQFESFRDPFVIMMSVPLSIFGAMLFLNFGLATLNIYTQVGLVTLVGLITKHGIMMVEFANALRSEGRSRLDAIQEAARVRLRPILMTTAAMVLGVVPLLYADGAGAAARYSIGLVIVAGMSIGTLFTLFVVPVFYSYVARRDGAEVRAS